MASRRRISRHRCGRLRPTALLFLQRRPGGLYLLPARLGTTLPVSALVQPLLDLGPSDITPERAGT